MIKKFADSRYLTEPLEACYDIVDYIEHDVKTDKQLEKFLNNLKKGLNNFFREGNCKDIIVTWNTDKLFFGMCVYPHIHTGDVDRIMNTSEIVKISDYSIDIDSRLIKNVGVSGRELLACILHEIGHIICDSNNIKTVRRALDVYFAETDTEFSLDDMNKFPSVFIFAITDAIRKVDSIFNQRLEEEYIADEFVVACGYGEELESACRKIVKQTSKLNSNVQGKFIILQYTLNIYKDMKWRRVPALNTLNKRMPFEASTLRKKALKYLILDLKTIKKNDTYVQENTMQDLMTKLGTKYRYKGIKILDNEVYEFAAQISCCDEEDKALILLRDMNTRINILSEFIEITPVDKYDREVSYAKQTLARYYKLRDDLSKKKLYSDKYLGLWMATPVIKSRYDA